MNRESLFGRPHAGKILRAPNGAGILTSAACMHTYLGII